MAKVLIKKETIDPYFGNVSLLLPFDSNFQDFSTNNFTVIANGNAQISNTEIKFGGGSAYFNGNDYLVISENSAFNLGDGSNYTVEMWVNISSFQGQADAPRIISFETNSTAWGLIIDPNNPNGNLIWNNYGTSSGNIIANNAISLNTWAHIALVKNGSRVSLYVNGIEIGFRTDTNAMPNGNARITIGGSTIQYAYQEFYGYIDDLRITKGVARYTSNFIPPNRLPLNRSDKLNIKRGGVDQFFNNVSLLLPMDESFNDFSNNNFTLTSYGNPIISQDQSKFSSAAGYFGPSNDYLSAASSSLFGFGTGDFTIEMWIYPQGTSAFQGFFNANDYTNGILMRWHATSQSDSLYINSTYYDWQPAIHAPVNTWSHIALVRYGGTVKMFVNGVNRIGSATNNSDIGSTAIPLIGASAHSTNEGFNGYINELRVTKGVARYTADFTPPTNKFSIGERSGKVKINKPTFPMKDLLAFWKLNDTSDSSGNNNNLTDNNGVIFGEPGVVGNGARTTWGNNGSYLTTNLSVGGDSTLSLWFRFDSLPVPNPQGYQDRHPLVFQKYPYCALGTNSNYPRKLILTDMASWGIWSTNEIFTVGQWCHLVTTIENNKAKVYADGVLILETPAQYTNNFNSGGRLLGFGGDNVDFATSYGTDTRYDSIGMWSRALTYNEVMTLYNNGNGLEL